MYGFLSIGDTTIFDKIHHTVGEHLRMNAQILVAVQCIQHGIRYVANAHLQCGSISHQMIGNQLTDLCFLVGWRFAAVRWQRLIDTRSIIEMRLMDYGIAESAWHLLIDLGHNAFGML